eukprot:6640212-Pyramimonas_sp.AAC.1
MRCHGEGASCGRGVMRTRSRKRAWIVKWAVDGREWQGWVGAEDWAEDKHTDDEGEEDDSRWAQGEEADDEAEDAEDVEDGDEAELGQCDICHCKLNTIWFRH